MRALNTAFLCVLGVAFPLGPSLAEATVRPGAGAMRTTLSNDGAWCWFQDPRAVYVEGERPRTYAGWMTSRGQLQVGGYDHETGEIEIRTIKEDWDIDDHNTNSFLVLPDGRLMIFYARHNHDGLYCRTSTAPESISSWEEEVTVTADPGVTYSHPVFLADEGLIYVFWRGTNWKPDFATSADGRNWTAPRTLIMDPEFSGEKIRPYIKVATDGVSRISIAFTDDHPKKAPQNSVYLLQYQGGRFPRLDGEVIGDLASLPIAPRSCDIVYDGRTTTIPAWLHDIALDPEGRPVIAYTRFPHETDHRYHVARWDGADWIDTQVASGGRWFPQTPEGEAERQVHYSGGMSLNQDDPSEIYLSQQFGDVFEICKWVTLDDGRTWKSTPVTSGSSHLNVRPVVPHGWMGEGDHVLWMSGNYRHYEAYFTAIEMLVPGR